jgi:hypothetical protein
MIYTKTELGRAVLQDRSLGLSPRQRSAFILFDGTRGLDEVLKLTNALGVTADDISRLVELALLVPKDVAADRKKADAAQPTSAWLTALGAALPGLSASASEFPTLDDQVHYARAYPIAVRLTSNLGLRGFRLNLAVESAADLEALKALAPKIKEAVGVDKFRELEDALYR